MAVVLRSARQLFRDDLVTGAVPWYIASLVGFGQHGAGSVQAYTASLSAVSLPGTGWSTWEGTQMASVWAVRRDSRSAASVIMSWFMVLQGMMSVGWLISLVRVEWTPLGSMNMNSGQSVLVARNA